MDGFRDYGPLYVAVGDSITVWLKEEYCRYDLCGMRGGRLRDSGYAVTDSGVAMAHRAPVAPEGEVFAATLLGLRPGRTQVSALGIVGTSDTMPGNQAAPRTVSRDLIVTVPIARVVIESAPDTVTIGKDIIIEARAYDSAGTAIPDVPIRITLQQVYGMARYTEQSRARLRLRQGQYKVIAAFGGRADTTDVVVLLRSP